MKEGKKEPEFDSESLSDKSDRLRGGSSRAISMLIQANSSLRNEFGVYSKTRKQMILETF